MSNGSELKSPSAKALRAAGYLPLPRWWVKKEDLDLIEYMAKQHQAEVNRIRNEARAGMEARADGSSSLTTEEQIELAWSMRNSCK